MRLLELLTGELAQLGHLGGHLGERQLGLDDIEVQTPYVLEDLPGGPRGLQVMAVSAEGADVNQATIAQRLGIDRTVMTCLVDDLEKAGMVERRPDPADRRARQVVVTATGRRVLTDASSRMVQIERTVLGALPDADIETFRLLLTVSRQQAVRRRPLPSGCPS
ncbi:MarR family transcriptional regulator [Aeromicrobium sp. S22]|uniref:MarR family winged helix-turn-helix transcriptional regulator n=1 Tax=Aeromicrobium sp. S22 TaxID=2662029 RepID=UPI00129E8469|nr:MarR family winged helix-turn-helix transcriptional regulator [Aeromicrobium sp. S22]MRJ99982.1 MarR family transcriptional regulator [Aeromicrobium sp. S22]